MPIYLFKCEDCGEYEAIVPVGTTEHTCKCGKKSKKTFTPTRFTHSRGAVEVDEVRNQGTIVRHEEQHYFKPDKKVFNKESSHDRARSSHVGILKKKAESGEPLRHEDIKVLNKNMNRREV